MLTCHDFMLAVALSDLLEGRRKQRSANAGPANRPRVAGYFISSSRSR